MATQFEDQGGAATSNPSRLTRYLTSLMMRRQADPRRRQKIRSRAEAKRLRAGLPHRVEYFHQVDDAYSHLAAQLLQPLLDLYTIELVPHLVATSRGANAPEPELLLQYARYDSAKVAPHYGLSFPATAEHPRAAASALAERILASVGDAEFPSAATAVGAALWSAAPAHPYARGISASLHVDDAAGLEACIERFGIVDAAQAQARSAQGTARRKDLGHYSGAMFYYGGEWYWGADRLYHLEQRLRDLGACRHPDAGLLAPRPPIDAPIRRDHGSQTLEIYLSLRSPYTAIIFDRAIQLARDSGVSLSLRPVLPMVMRGVPATREKGFYIFFDTAREAETLGLRWGNACDPIGDPVRRAYSLYPWAREMGREVELISAFLHGAFFDAVDTTRDRGLRRIVETAGLDWEQARARLGNREWEDEFEANRLSMYGFGCWGVPCFRLLDAQGTAVLTSWGQDRLWLVAREINKLLKTPPAAAPT